MVPTPVSRRRAVLGGGAALATASVGAGVALHRSGRVEVPLYSETVAFSAPGVRELVPAGRPEVLVPGTRVVAARPHSPVLVDDEQAWLESCSPWARARLHDDDGLLVSALLDLRALSLGLPATVAGWTDRWRYAWPRDVSFVAAALARVGHPEDAVAQLAFLQGVQRPDGWFEARYDLETRRTPDGRALQLDGSGWVVWAAGQVAAAAPDRADGLLAPLRPVLVRSARRLLASLDPETALPPPSSDYWELLEDRLTLGTVAAVLAGLRSVTQVLPIVGERALADRTRAAAERLAEAVLAGFGPPGYPRQLGGAAADAAVTFLVAPIGVPEPDAAVLTAMTRAQTTMARPAGGLAPGAAWKQDGISWTAETALFAVAWAATGHRARAELLLRWLGDHRTGAGSFPEKVLHDGRPAAVAPLAWTAALVVMACHELARR